MANPQQPHEESHRSAGWTVRIGLTLGDVAGIGPEVILQALKITQLARRVRVKLFVAAELTPWLTQALGRAGLPLDAASALPGLELCAVAGHAATLREPRSGETSLASREQAFRALDAMAQAAVQRDLDVMVTGPVPKGIFDHLHPRPPGQTEFLAQRLGAQRFAMMLYGSRLHVVPVTTHVPLADVPKLLTVERIVETGLAAVDALVQWLDIAAPRLAVCGLNPHAGEEGRLGDEESRIIAPATRQLQAAGIDARGPVVADTVFHQAMSGAYDAVLCMYHDQALGPFKTVHFHDGSNLTCGMAVPRISPDHGTAYAIAGQGIADPTSMVQTCMRAEQMAVRIRTARGGSNA